jgi:hypothetical protein
MFNLSWGYTLAVVVLLILFLVVVIGGGVLLVRFAKSMQPRERVVLVAVIIIALVYFVPKVVQAAIRGYHVAVEMDRQDRR